MTTRLDPQTLSAAAMIVAAPVAGPRACEDRTFGLPISLHIGTAVLFIAFMLVMAGGFRSPGLIIPMAINFIFIAAFFTVPGLWARMKPDNASHALGFDEFMAGGVDTYTGRSSGGAAFAQVMIMPLMILFWGFAAVTIAALV